MGTTPPGNSEEKSPIRPGPKAERRQVVLEDAGSSAQRNRRQKLLQRLVLFSLDRLFAVLRFLQAEVVRQAHTHSLVQRELQHLVRRRMRRHAPIRRIGRRTRVRLSVDNPARAGKGQNRTTTTGAFTRRKAEFPVRLTSIIFSDDSNSARIPHHTRKYTKNQGRSRPLRPYSRLKCVLA